MPRIPRVWGCGAFQWLVHYEVTFIKMSFVSIDLSRKVASTIISDVMIDDSSVLVQVNIDC